MTKYTKEPVPWRMSDRACDIHPDELLVELLIQSDKLQRDWVIRVCPVCNAEQNTER